MTQITRNVNYILKNLCSTSSKHTINKLTKYKKNGKCISFVVLIATKFTIKNHLDSQNKTCTDESIQKNAFHTLIAIK